MSEHATHVADPRQFPRFAGVATFCRYPLIELVPQENRPVDWAIYGFPFDAGVTYRPGARFGPRAIREASQYVKPYHIEHDLDVTELLSLADAGDAPIRPFSCKQTLDATVEFAAGLGDAGVTKLMGVGGDHSLAYAGLKATWQRRGRPSGGLAMIHFDSHVDTVDETGGERYSHASPFIRAVEEGFLDPKRMISIGIKGPLNTRRDLDYAKQNGVEILTCERWRREGETRIRAFLDRLGNDASQPLLVAHARIVTGLRVDVEVRGHDAPQLDGRPELERIDADASPIARHHDLDLGELVVGPAGGDQSIAARSDGHAGRIMLVADEEDRRGFRATRHPFSVQAKVEQLGAKHGIGRVSHSHHDDPARPAIRKCRRELEKTQRIERLGRNPRRPAHDHLDALLTLCAMRCPEGESVGARRNDR
ncbi:MAG: arginase family protein [Planctomycetes bacterium]|nr:arginase family protein [Planctomycetota bacterium]